MVLIKSMNYSGKQFKLNITLVMNQKKRVHLN